MSQVVRLSPEPTTRLRLYIAGDSVAAERARAQCVRLVEQNADIVIDEIDVLEHPALADAAGILATPTLSDESRSPPRRIVGDMSDVERVLDFLGLQSRS